MLFFHRFRNLFSYNGHILLIAAFSYNCLIYGICNAVTKGWRLHSLALSVDTEIPFLPWTILIYFGCYLFWAVNYILIYGKSREQACRFLTADMLSRTVCMICFLVYPTTLERPAVEGSGIFESLMRFLYTVDAPVNLFPSIHCLCSWYCYIGIRKDKEVPAAYRYFSLIYAIAVFLSTLTTKQHVTADVFGGVALAQITYYIGMKTEGWRYLERTFDKISGWLKPHKKYS